MVNRFIILLALFSALSLSSGWGHEGNQHVMGTVIAIDGSHIEVKPPQGGNVSVILTEKTGYASKNTPPTSRPKVGDRVVIDVVKEGNGLKALGMEFATPRAQPNGKK